MDLSLDILVKFTFGASFHQRFGHGEAEPSSTTRDGDDPIFKVEFAKPLSILPACHWGYFCLDVVRDRKSVV